MSLTLYYGRTSYSILGAKPKEVTRTGNTIHIKVDSDREIEINKSASLAINVHAAEILAYQLLANVAQIRSNAAAKIAEAKKAA